MIELSGDGRLLLTKGKRDTECSGPGRRCRVDVLVVYDAASGKNVGEYAAKKDASIWAAGFLEGSEVLVVELSYDAQQKRSVAQGLHWDASSSRQRPITFAEAAHLMPACPVGPTRFLATNPASNTSLLAVVDTNAAYALQQPALPGDQDRTQFFAKIQNNCSAWRSGSSFLVQSAGPGVTLLHWISTNPSEAPRVSHAFTEEHVQGYAVSPDGSLVAVITSTGRMAESTYHVFVNVLAARDGALLRRMEIRFPEQPGWKAPLLNPKAKYLDNVPFDLQVAQQVAISPDNKTLAIAYGISRDPDGLAFFGLYSLPDGRRLVTLPGDAYKCGILHGALLNDELHCQQAPINGAMQFSPDSRTLFATSKCLYQFDVSALQ